MKANHEPFVKQKKENEVSGQFCTEVPLQYPTVKQNGQGADEQNNRILDPRILNLGQICNLQH